MLPPINPMQGKNLYKVETFTDMMSGSIIKHTPVNEDGSADPLREAVFSGNTVMNTNRGPMPLDFPIKAQSLAQAIDMFSNSLRDLLDEMESNMTRQRILSGSQVTSDVSKIINGKGN
jgi:hypothetical protein